MKVIVTGGTGFFGPAIVARLEAGGHDVVAASRRASGASRLDVTDPASCRALLDAHPGTHAVVHAAALAHVPPGTTAAAASDAVNVEGTRNIVHAALASGVRRFVLISSVTVYGDCDLPVPVTETTAPRRAGMYGAAKRRAEEILERDAPGLDRWVLRMSTMYSPEWLFNVRKRISLPVVGRFAHVTLDPHGRRYTLCSRRNGAEAVAWAVERRLAPGVYNVSEQHVYSQAEIVRAVERVDGVKPHVPMPVSWPRAAAVLAELVPVASVRDAARSRYWKFCEHNVYSADKLAAHGLVLPPDLLELTAPAPCP